MSPIGLVVDTVSMEGDRVLVSAHPISLDAACTGCGQRSARIHSRYERQLQDLPAHGRCVRLQVQVRRFRCGNAACKRQIFGELNRPGFVGGSNS
jgi:transposase